MLVSRDFSEEAKALGLHPTERARFIGEEIDGQLVCLVMFDNYNGANIEAHIVASRITRKMTRAAFRYVFEVCGCRRVTSLNDSSNFTMKPYLERLGFKYEGTIRHGLPDSDLIVYGMIREECKWVSPKQAA